MRSLYTKLALTLTALLLAMGMIYLMLTQTMLSTFQSRSTQWLNKDLAANLVKEHQLVNNDQLDPDALKSTFTRFMNINPNIEIYLLDVAGNIIGFSADPDKVKRSTVALEPIQAFLDGDQPFPILGDDPRNLDSTKSFSATRVPSGYLYVILRSSHYDAFAQAQHLNWFLRMSAWIVAGSLLFGLVVGLFGFSLLTRRLRQLTASMEAFRRGGFETEPTFVGRGWKWRRNRPTRRALSTDGPADQATDYRSAADRQPSPRNDQ